MIPVTLPLGTFFEAVIVVGIIIAFLLLNIDNDDLVPPAKQMRAFAITLCTLVALVLLAGFLPWLIENAAPIARTALGTLAIILISLCLFGLKLSALRVYACLEILFAIGVSAQSMYGLGDAVEPVRLFGLLTAVYLTIRGLDNFNKDLDDRKKKAEEAKRSASASV